jgi:recombinational DNA repair ATPase RecF
MKINSVTIRNVLGIEQLSFEAGRFNEISGRNGSGKTSVLQAIIAGIQGGSLATLLRDGATEGEIVLDLDDGMSIRRRITDKGATVTVKQGGVTMPKPQDIINRLADMLSVNPVDFLLADKKERAKVLLETMPIRLDVAGCRRSPAAPSPHPLKWDLWNS